MDSPPALAPHRSSIRVALAALVLTTSGLLASGPSLQTVRLVVGDGATSIILSADGALPAPKVGVLTDPPRIYLDFLDVAAATDGVRGDGDPRVRGVRVAVNQSRPLVTRVVIDLAQPSPHRLEAGRRDTGQLTLVVGVPTAPAGAPPTRPKPPPAEPPKAAAPATAPATVPAVPATAPAALRPPQTGEPAARAARPPEPPRPAAATAARARPVAPGPSLQAVRLVDVGDGEASVFLSADGALPSPEVGVLADPPRIYLDFPGVAAATEGVRVNGDLLVRGVRVSVSQSQPLVTRVVIDLARPAPHRIEAGQRDSGQLTVVVGVPAAPAGAPTPRPYGQPAAGIAPTPPTSSPGRASEGRCPGHGAGNGSRRACNSAGRNTAAADWRTGRSSRPFTGVRARRRSDGCPSAGEGCCSGTCSEPHPRSNAWNGSARCWGRSMR